MGKYTVTALSTVLLLSAAVPVWAQSCQTRDEISPQVKTAIESAAQQVFLHASQDNANAIRANTIPSFSNSIVGVGTTIKRHSPGPQPPSFAPRFCSTQARHRAGRRLLLRRFRRQRHERQWS